MIRVSVGRVHLFIPYSILGRWREVIVGCGCDDRPRGLAMLTGRLCRDVMHLIEQGLSTMRRGEQAELILRDLHALCERLPGEKIEVRNGPW